MSIRVFVTSQRELGSFLHDSFTRTYHLLTHVSGHGAHLSRYSVTHLCVYSTRSYVWSPSFLLVLHTILNGATLTLIETCGLRPSCVRRSLICFLTCTLITTYFFILPSATSATRSAYSLRLRKSFLNLGLGLGISYVFASVMCVLGSYWCRAGLSFICISNFVC